MNNPYGLLEGVLAFVEKKLREGINVELTADEFDISSRHLQRLFKLAFNQSLGLYIRSRKAAASIDDLLNTNLNVLDIALDYGFEYEQSYIRSFKREYGITPGDLRKTKKILKIIPPLNLFDAQKYSDGIMFKPEIVMVPSFCIIGKPHKFTGFDSQKDALEPNKLALKFKEELSCIPNMINPLIYVGYVGYNNVISGVLNNVGNIEYMPSALVKDLSSVPGHLKGLSIPAHQCARFRYIGEHHYEEISMVTAKSAYLEIDSFLRGQSRYVPLTNYFVEWLDTSTYDGTYCQFEWLFPVKEAVNTKLAMSNILSF
jgi:AraC family transcriptional regulator